jgi:hypothetical protein
VLRWSGLDWLAEVEVSGLTTANLRALWGSATDDRWFVGDGGTALHLQSMVGAVAPTGTTADLLAIWGNSKTDVVAVGAGGVLAHYDGNAWTATTLAAAAGNSLRAAFGAAPGAIWLAGDAGTILRWDGTTATAIPTGVSAALRALWGSGASDVWAVGDAGTILHYDGAAWTPHGQSGQLTSHALLGLWGYSANEAWAVGELGEALHWDGTAWSLVDSEVAGNLNGVWQGADRSIVVGGQDGNILRKSQ